MTTLFEEVGGSPVFERLVDLFYAGVVTDPVLSPMYPETDLVGARHRMATFLVQYWGGPRTYSEERGHPRLRLRHAPFQVDDDARRRWLTHMRVALDGLEISDGHKQQLWSYFERAAATLVSR